MSDRFPHASLEQTDHRPWPPPERRWVMKQVWRDLLFLHWEADAKELQRRLPPGLELDLFDGKAWLGVIPFEMEGVTLRGCPAPPVLCDFPELNVRTYVKRDGMPGVWFFSLDVTKAPAVWAARMFFHLPYFKANMRVERSEAGVRYRHKRGRLKFEASYRPAGPFEGGAESFGDWATSRYCLYSRSPKGRLFRGHIHHAPWPLQRAEFDLRENTLLDGYAIGDRHPTALYADKLHVVVYPLEKL